MTGVLAGSLRCLKRTEPTLACNHGNTIRLIPPRVAIQHFGWHLLFPRLVPMPVLEVIENARMYANPNIRIVQVKKRRLTSHLREYCGIGTNQLKRRSVIIRPVFGADIYGL